MNKNWKKLLCLAAAMLLMAGCRSGGGETTDPAAQTATPTVTLPQGEGVEDWDDPIEETDPVETTAPQPGTTDCADSTESTTESTEVPTQSTEPTEDTQPPVQNTSPTEPDGTNPPAEPPATTQPQAGGSDPAKLTYEEYLAMSPYEQQAHYESFPSLEAYIAWHNAALAEYEENQDSIEVTGGIDIGDFMNP